MKISSFFLIFIPLIISFPTHGQDHKSEIINIDTCFNAKASNKISAQTIIDNYILAIGGKDKLERISDISIKASTNMNGMVINQKLYKKAPNKYAMIMLMDDNVIIQQAFNGIDGIMKGYSGIAKILGQELEDLKIDATLNLELQYFELGVKLIFENIETVDGKEAYKIKIVNPTGKTSFDYYDVLSGLKIQSKETIVAPQGEFTQTQSFSNYQAVDSIFFPFNIKVTGIQNLTLKVDTIKINSELSDELFEK